MPIVGLTDRGLSFPEIGQIRKGSPKTGNRPGEDLPYFRVIFDERETKAQQDFLAVYGAQPTAIRVILPFNEIDRQWSGWMEAYTAGRMVARSDGEYFQYLVDVNTGELLVKNGIDLKTNLPRPSVEIVGHYKTKNGSIEPIKLKASGRLKVIIPELARAAYLTVLTTSVHDIMNISDQLRAFQTINAGRIAGIPLVLRRRPKKISTPVDPLDPSKGRARRVKSLLSIEADPEWVRAALAETQRLALPGGGHLAALPAGKLDQPLVEEPEPGDEYEPDEDEQEDGIEDGHYTVPEPEMPAEPEPAPEPAPAAPAETNGNARPYNPAVLKSKLANAAANYQGKTPTDKQIQLMAMLIASAFAGENDHDMRRHAVQAYLFGAASLKDASGPLILASLNNWLKPTTDSGGEYHADAIALREIQLAYVEALKVQGQLELL